MTPRRAMARRVGPSFFVGLPERLAALRIPPARTSYAILAVAGAVSVVLGVALWSVPLALVLGGGATCYVGLVGRGLTGRQA